MIMRKSISSRRQPGIIGGIAAFTVATLALTGCGGSSSDASNDDAASDVSVAALISGTNVPYLATYADAMQAEADEQGVDLRIYSADFDASKQAEQFSQAINSDPDAIVVAAVDATSVVPSLLQAQQADIPVIASNTGVDESGVELIAGFTGPNDLLQGAEAAKLMVEATGGTGQIGIIEGALGTTAQINRSKGFIDEIEKSAPGITILDRQTAEWDKEKAREVAANFITRFGDDLTGIFAEDDTMASGAAQAIADAGKTGEIALVGLGGSQLGFDGVTDGSIYGTIIQSPVQDGALAIDAAVKVAKGESVEPNQYIEPVTVTVDNVDEYTAEW